MAESYPYDLLLEFPGWSTDFDLMYRQERSTSASGRTYVKDFGSPLWRASYQSRQLRPNELDRWRAELALMEGGLREFLGRATSRCYPIADPAGRKLGAPPPATVVSSINSNRKELVVGPIPSGYVVSVGDLVQIGARNLHRVVGSSETSPGSGTNALEVRPHLWPEIAVGDAVKFVRPSCRMVIVPDSIRTTADVSTGRGAVSFDAMESR